MSASNNILYTVDIYSGTITKTPIGGFPITIVGQNVVTESGQLDIRKMWNQSVFSVVLNLVNGRQETFDLANITNQPTWTNDAAGLAIAASDMRQALLSTTIQGPVGDMFGSNNLSELTNTAAAQNNLGLGPVLALKADLVGGLVPAAQLPSYVDEVLEYANLAAFPVTGAADKLYVALDSNLIYRWSGTIYSITSSALALGQTAATAYPGNLGAANAAAILLKADISHTHDGSDIVSGLIAPARLGAGTANNTTFLRGDNTWVPVPTIGTTVGTAYPGELGAANAVNIAANTADIAANTVGIIANTAAIAGKANTVHTHDASAIVTGVLNTARLGTGTANATTVLKGDGTWGSVPGGGSGDVIGPASSTNNYPVLMDGTTGKLIKQGLGPLGTAAYLNVGQTTGTVAAGNDPRFGALATIADRPGLETFAKKTGQGTYFLDEVYGLDYINGSMKLNELYLLLDAKNKFEKLFEWYTSPGGGQNDAWVMNMYHGSACYMEAVLQGNISTPLGIVRLGSNNTVFIPNGIYLTNIDNIYDGNKIRGRGTNTAFIGADNTVLAMDNTGWQGIEDPFERAILWPSTYGGNTGSSWTEGCDIDNLRLEGGRSWSWYDNTFESSGIRTWDLGECARIGKIYGIGFNGHAIKTERGTPTYIDELSAFTNALGGLGIYGGALGTVRVNVISGDDNPSLIRVRPSNGRVGGGNISIGMVKSESGKRVPVRGQIIVDAADQSTEGVSMNLNIQTVWAAVDVKYVDALFVVKGFTTGGNASRVTIGGISGYNYATLFHDVANGKRWSSPGDYSHTGFTWNGGGGGNLTFNSTADATAYPGMIQGTVNASQRLGMRLPGDPAYNYVAGTPAYNVNGGGLPNGTPDTNRANAFAGMRPSIVQTGTTAQGFGRLINYDYQPIASGVTLDWSIVSGPATINNVTGLLTANAGVTSDTTVVVRCSFITTFIDFPITITP